MSEFVKSPLDYSKGSQDSPGHYGGDKGYPQRSGYGSGVPEKTFDKIPEPGPSPAVGSPGPVIQDPKGW